MSIHVRPATTTDIPEIERIAVAAHMFPEPDVGFLGEQLLAATDAAVWLVAEVHQRIIGAAYCAPKPFADKMWNVYFIAVEPTAHRSGVGRALMSRVEHDLSARGADVARTVVVETSSTEQYSGARAFYAGLGYAEEARIRDFYGPGDAKVVFRKSLVG